MDKAEAGDTARRLARLIFAKRESKKGTKRVEIHITENDLVVALATAYELGRSGPRDDREDCPDCEGGNAIVEYCALCEQPVYETCKTCDGSGKVGPKARAPEETGSPS